MKWLTAVIAGMLLSGCTITVTPITAPKKAIKRSHSSTPKHKKKSVSWPNIKETWWIENYHKLEAAHGDYRIPDDANIEPMSDGRFRVPDNVLTHYQDLLLVTPTPNP